ncbi:MAG: ABC transporter ATP-binding protein [Methanospirillum sp.]|uniref:ABC transporter ATP-binding protein n=1 Tax=Methanospirillum sp. TaxID=45200 RepID=UPI00236DFDA2|nr:ABC transporter ATP-binding protein [Methanospirillum sp.]MDD1728250.1 ABC transporter ATP-binding protein [Methanospirillum sp.]
MSDVVIQVENLCKEYRLGTISHGTLYRDLQSGWAKFRGKDDPNSIIGSHNRGQMGNTDDRILALNNVSFDIHQGEVVGIIGRNGAGKSTLLKIISRVTAPTSGTIKIKGRGASLLEVGTGFHPELPGRENIFLNGAILGMRKSEIEQKFDEIVKFAEIDKFIDTPVKRYSSGMYVRLAFAVAAHLDTDILLVDEVLAVGDVAFQKKSLNKMKNVTSEGRTVLIVSHSMPIIRNNCKKVIFLKNGAISAFDIPAVSVDSYLNAANEESRYLVKEITSEMHTTGISKIRVKKIQMVDENGNIQEHIKYHQPLIIEVFIECIDAVDNVGFGIIISTKDNVILLQTHCFDKSNAYWNLVRGRFKVQIRVLNQLKRGHYSLQFGAHQKPFNVSLLDIPNALTFEITDEPFQPEENYSQFNGGLLDSFSDWSLIDI